MASKPSAHTPENTIRVSIERVVIPAGHEVIRDGRRVRLERTARAWQFTIPSSRASLGVDDHNVLVETSGAWACCSCAAAVNRDRCTLVDNPTAILRHHGLLPGGPAWPEPYAPAVTDDDRAVAERLGPPAHHGGAAGEPPGLAGPTAPAPRAARKPLSEHLDLLYGEA